MAKRTGNLYVKNCTYEQLYYAYKNAARGKRYRGDVLHYTDNLEENLLALLDELRDHTYKVGEYREFYVYEPKKRLIMALPFRDRVVQWWLYEQLYPVFDKTFIDDSFACRRGKGQKAAADRLQYFLKQTEVLGGKWYYLKLDIAKYFYRVDHEILLNIVRRKVKDPGIIDLLQKIINDQDKDFGLTICDNVESAERVKGIGMPIGNLTSQLLANVYLNELDHFCKQELGIRHYVRYMDDVIILGRDKAELRQILQRIEVFLNEHLRLELNKKTALRPVSMGVKFVGLTVWSTHRNIVKGTTLRIKRGLKHQAREYKKGNITWEQYNSTLQSYLGLMKHNDCEKFKLALLKEVDEILAA